MERITFTEIKDGKYNVNSKDMFFKTEKGILTITPEQALEIAYTLFDNFGFPYSVLENLEGKIIDEKYDNQFEEDEEDINEYEERQIQDKLEESLWR